MVITMVMIMVIMTIISGMEFAYFESLLLCNFIIGATAFCEVLSVSMCI